VADDAYRFDRFLLDPRDRRLLRDGEPVDLNGRYLDALALLVREQGRLVTKTRFHDEVWRGVPVTDEALTQCIRTLRSRLGDDAGRPRFIETVPKHGYRFIADVVAPGSAEATLDEVPRATAARPSVREAVSRQGRAGMIGGGVAGLVGGLIYGFVGVLDPQQAGGSALSAILVIAALAMTLGLLGGAGVAFGIAASAFAPERRGLWGVVGGAAGGLLVGAVAKAVGLDAFDLLFGQAPAAITGAPEGAILGGAVGLGAWAAALRPASRRASTAIAGLVAGMGGALIALSGGRLLGGSLDQLADLFPGSRLRLDQLGALFGEAGFGPSSQTATASLEGLLFGASGVAAMRLAATRRIGEEPS